MNTSKTSVSPALSTLELLQAQVDAYQAEIRTEEGRSAISSVFELVTASRACGAELTLNANQVRSLSVFMDAVNARVELNRASSKVRTSEPKERKIIPFEQYRKG